MWQLAVIFAWVLLCFGMLGLVVWLRWDTKPEDED